MAWALAHGRPIPNIYPPAMLKLSDSPHAVAPVAAPIGVLPRRMQSTRDVSEAELYALVRPFGAIYAIRLVGGARDATIQFWDEEEACNAERGLRDAHGMALRAYDPCSLYCQNLDLSMTTAMLRAAFSEFGNVASVQVTMRKTRRGGSGFVSFNTPEEAALAMKEMDGRVIESKVLKVQYQELQASMNGEVARLDSANIDGDRSGSSIISCNNASKALGEGNAEIPQAEETKTEATDRNEIRACFQEELDTLRAELALEKADAAERLQSETYKRIAAEDQLAEKQGWWREERRAHSRETGRLESQLNKLREQATADKQEWESLLAKTETEVREERRKRRVAEGALAVEQMARQAEVVELRQQLDVSESRQKMLELDRDRQLWEKTRKKREQQEKEELAKADAAWRAAEVMETQRRMHELLKQEEARKRAAEAERKRKAAEEKAQREKAEKERKAREVWEAQERERREAEERERQERERIEAARRDKARKRAALQERRRIAERDNHLWGSVPWSKTIALQRFIIQSEEFERLKFSDAQPLTAEAVPWPILRNPAFFQFADLAWSEVEAFFKAANAMMPGPEYAALIEKSHRLMHPDKWRSRNILKTCVDDTLRMRIEKAGNIVAQALTPIWLESRT